MTILADAECNAVADFLASRITEMSLHTDSPYDGAYEVAGGTPAYARQSSMTFTPGGAVGVLGVDLQPATVGVAWSSQVTFDAPAGTYTYWGAWVAGVFAQGEYLSPSQTLDVQGQVTYSIGVGPVYGG